METTKTSQVAEARKQTGMSQYALAKASGITQAHLGKIETGEIASPRVDIALAIAAALHMDVKDLFTPRAA